VLALIAAVLCAGCGGTSPYVERREGFVVANNSSRGGSVNEAVGKLWSQACRALALIDHAACRDELLARSRY
jgi:hypothetical protein